MRRDDWLTHQLPVGMAEDAFLFNFVTIFQRVADTVVHQIDTMQHQFDPTVAPTSMVRTMAAWLGVDWIDSSMDDELQRRIVTEYSRLLQWRGTKPGLERLLRLLGDGDVRVTDNGGVFAEGESPVGSPHVKLEMESVSQGRIRDVVRIIQQELPATVRFELLVAGDRVWPDDTPELVSHGYRPEPQTADTTTGVNDG